MFEPWAEHRLAPFHRVLTVNAGDLEDTIKSDNAINGIRSLLLDNIPAASARTGVRLVIDTFTNPEINALSCLFIHMLGDFDEDLVTDAKSGKPVQRRWFETPVHSSTRYGYADVAVALRNALTWETGNSRFRNTRSEAAKFARLLQLQAA